MFMCGLYVVGECMIVLCLWWVDWLIGIIVLVLLFIVWLMIIGLDVLLQFLCQFGYVGKNGFIFVDVVLYVLVIFLCCLYENFGYVMVIGGLFGLGSLVGSGEFIVLCVVGMLQLCIVVLVVGVVVLLIVGVVIFGEMVVLWGDQKVQVMQLCQCMSGLGMVGFIGLWVCDGWCVINVKISLFKQVNGYN